MPRVVIPIVLFLGLLLPAGNAMAQDAGRALLYTLCSKCNIVLERNGDAADVEIGSRKYKARISRDPNNPEFKTVHAGNNLLFRISLSGEASFILNDRYQQGCEAAKLILLNDPSANDAADALRKYLDDHSYVLDDTAAMLQKSRFMRNRHWNASSIIVLETMLAKHPNAPDAWLLLADIYNDTPDRKPEAKAAYATYLERVKERYGKGAMPEKRGY